MNVIEEILQYSRDMTVLYVEDEPTLREETREFFEDFFTTIIEAEDGQAGLERYERFYEENGKHFDLVITDLNMPRLSGEKMIEGIRGINPEQSIIVVSAHSESERLLNLISLGIRNFILKPMLPEPTVTVLYKAVKDVAAQKILEGYYDHVESENLMLGEALHEKIRELEALNRDLTQKVKDQTAQMLLQSRRAAMGDVMNTLAHQWRQPLNYVVLLLDRIAFMEEEEPRNKEELEKNLQEAQKTILELSRTIDTMRGYFGDEADETVPLQVIVQDAVALLQPQMEEGKVILEWDDCPGAGEVAVQKHMIQVLVAVLKNSLENFALVKTSNPAVHISCNTVDGRIELKIMDNGGGVQPAQLGHIFDPYVSSKGLNGKGMGLYVAREVVEKQLNGTIGAENSGEGLMTTIVLPPMNS